MIICIGPTPAAQRVMVFDSLAIDAVNRAAMTLDGVAGKSINVAKVLKALGEQPLATGFLGGPRGQQLHTALRKQKIRVKFVAVPVPTRQCITVINQATGQHTELVEESRPVTKTAYADLWNIIQHHSPSCRAMIMSGTMTPGGPVDFYERCTRLTHRHDALAVVDAQGPSLLRALTARPSLVKPNRTELARTLQRTVKTLTELKTGMRALHEQGAERVVVTAGKLPTLAFDGKSYWRITVPAIMALNPIGSGDSFTAGLVWRLLRGDDLGEACRWGAAAGTANALTWMAGEIKLADVHRLAKRVRVERG